MYCTEVRSSFCNYMTEVTLCGWLGYKPSLNNNNYMTEKSPEVTLCGWLCYKPSIKYNTYIIQKSPEVTLCGWLGYKPSIKYNTYITQKSPEVTLCGWLGYKPSKNNKNYITENFERTDEWNLPKKEGEQTGVLGETSNIRSKNRHHAWKMSGVDLSPSKVSDLSYFFCRLKKMMSL